jgi:hypothetical protein
MSSTKLGSAEDVELLIIAVVALSSFSRPINVFKVCNPIAKDISFLSKTNIYSSNGFHNPNFFFKKIFIKTSPILSSLPGLSKKEAFLVMITSIPPKTSLPS